MKMIAHILLVLWAGGSLQASETANEIAVSVIEKHFSPSPGVSTEAHTGDRYEVRRRLNKIMASNRASEEARLCYAITLIDDKIKLARLLKSSTAPIPHEEELLAIRATMLQRLDALTKKTSTAAQEINKTAEQEKDQGQATVESRAYALAGYIPKFYMPPVDPFSPETNSGLKKYQDEIAEYLKNYGITAKEIKYIGWANSLILTDTREKLDTYEGLLRGLFQPEMLLRAIEIAKTSLADKSLFKDDYLSRIVLMDDVSLRAFHGEVRKLEVELNLLPDANAERTRIEKRLKVAKTYRESAMKLYQESLEKQKALIEEWQRDTKKTEQESAPNDR